MKHKMIKKGWRAYCEHPCCSASIDGGIVESMSDSRLQAMFNGECPAVWNGNGSLSGKEAIAHILEYGKKEIKTWEKAIKFWDKHYKLSGLQPKRNEK